MEPIRDALEKSREQIARWRRSGREPSARCATQIETSRRAIGAAARDAQPGDGAAAARGARPLGRADAAAPGGARRYGRALRLQRAGARRGRARRAAPGHDRAACRTAASWWWTRRRRWTPTSTAIEAATDEAARTCAPATCAAVVERVRELASKAYWEQFEHSPEFVVLFIPGDQFLSAALAEIAEAAGGRAPPERDHRDAHRADRAAESRRLRLAPGGARRECRRDPRTRPGTVHAPRHLRRTPCAHRAAPRAKRRRVQQRGRLARAPGAAGARKFTELGLRTGGEIEEIAPVDKLVRIPKAGDGEAVDE